MMLTPGTRLSSWVLGEQIGSGGMGSVYRARDAMISDETAAVKVLSWKSDLVDKRRFLREVEALRKVNHPAVVGVKNWGETPDGVLWLAMELVEGKSLASLMAERRLPLVDIPSLGRDLAEGLKCAHDQHIAHRDIKPQNVIVREGSAVIVDFGVAFHEDRTRLTRAGAIVGTPQYMAPEVFRGVEPSPQMADLYALGQMLYEMLTGTSPFTPPAGLTGHRAISWVKKEKCRYKALDPGTVVAAPLRDLVVGLTTANPGARIHDAAQVVSAIDRWLSGEPERAGEGDGHPVEFLGGTGTFGTVQTYLAVDTNPVDWYPDAGAPAPTMPDDGSNAGTWEWDEPTVSEVSTVVVDGERSSSNAGPFEELTTTADLSAGAEAARNPSSAAVAVDQTQGLSTFELEWGRRRTLRTAAMVAFAGFLVLPIVLCLGSLAAVYATDARFPADAREVGAPAGPTATTRQQRPPDAHSAKPMKPSAAVADAALEATDSEPSSVHGAIGSARLETLDESEVVLAEGRTRAEDSTLDVGLEDPAASSAANEPVELELRVGMGSSRLLLFVDGEYLADRFPHTLRLSPGVHRFRLTDTQSDASYEVARYVGPDDTSRGIYMPRPTSR